MLVIRVWSGGKNFKVWFVLELMSVLFVCRHNLARSPMAEYFYNELYGGGAKSAGTRVIDQGDVVPLEVWEVMNEMGICLKNHRTLGLVSRLVDEAGRIYVLCGREDCPSYLLESRKVEFWDVADPIEGKDSIRKARDEIREKILRVGRLG